MWSHYVAVGVGGALGSMMRLFLSRLLPDTLFTYLPFPILCVNVLGCFVMGALTEWLSVYYLQTPTLKMFLTTGFLGGFTTFSAFSLEFGLLCQKNFYGWALCYMASSVVASVIAFWIGLRLVRVFV